MEQTWQAHFGLSCWELPCGRVQGPPANALWRLPHHPQGREGKQQYPPHRRLQGCWSPSAEIKKNFLINAYYYVTTPVDVTWSWIYLALDNKTKYGCLCTSISIQIRKIDVNTHLCQTMMVTVSKCSPHWQECILAGSWGWKRPPGTQCWAPHQPPAPPHLPQWSLQSQGSPVSNVLP